MQAWRSMLAAVDRAIFRFLPTHTLKRFYFWKSIGAWRRIPLLGKRRVLIDSPLTGKMLLDKLEVVDRYIYFFGYFEPFITEIFRRNLKKGDLVIDIGANIGYYSLVASRLVGDEGAVVAVEPSPTILSVLRANIELNDLKNVRVVPVGISDKERTVPFFLQKAGNLGQSTTVATTKDHVFEGNVHLKPIEAILSRDELLRARLIKIDVEGSEGAVLLNILHNLPLLGTECIIVCEIRVDENSNDAWKSNRKLLQKYLSLGFQIFLITNEYTIDFYLEHQLGPLGEADIGRLKGCVDIAMTRGALLWMGAGETQI